MRGAISDSHLALIAQSFGCAEETARAIALQTHARHYPAHCVMIRAGDRDPDAWLMLSGEAHALAYGPGGHYLLVHRFVPGDMFGDAAGLSVAALGAEVTAVVDVDAGHLTVGVFVGLMERYSCVAISVAHALTQRLDQTTRRMVEGATLSSPGRIHAEMLRQARAGTAMTIRPMPSHAVFALNVQTTRETVSRAISALEKRGIIRRDGDGLTVVAPHRLEELIY